MGVLASLLMPQLKTNPGQGVQMNQDVSTETGPRPPRMQPPHPAVAMFPEYTPEQAVAMYNRMSPQSAPVPPQQAAPTGFGPTDSRLINALSGGGQ